MPKPRIQYICRECGAEFPQYFGRCPACEVWNSLEEQVHEPAPVNPLQRLGMAGIGVGTDESPQKSTGQPRAAIKLSEIADQSQSRMPSGYGELDRVLGGGIVPGSLVLIGGEPGIGKSTLLLQVANRLSSKARVLYVSAEESGQQVKLRSQRLLETHEEVEEGEGEEEQSPAPLEDDFLTPNPETVAPAPAVSIKDRHENGSFQGFEGLSLTASETEIQEFQDLLDGGLDQEEPAPAEFVPPPVPGVATTNGKSPVKEQDLYLLPETDLEVILRELESLKPHMAVIDSIQTIYFASLTSAPGSVAQVRECTSALMQVAKRENITLLIVGHVTKDGTLAGPRVLEHLVDTVLYFEGDRFASHRLLRSMKNRFGATHEIGVFEMVANGLKEISNPSELFLGNREEFAPGTSTVVALEGTRPIVVELQALVSPASYGSARRAATGIDSSRLLQILAVLEKRVGVPLSKLDAYVASVGGLVVAEPAADLGIAIAVVASFRDRIVDARTVMIGEVGLGGQVRPVSQLELRLREAAKLGFKRAIIPKGQKPPDLGMQILAVSKVSDAIIAAIPTQPATMTP